VPEHQKSNGTVEALELHAGRMGRLFNNTEYEAHCIPNILEHSKYMSAVELRNYAATMERLGGVYKQLYGNEVAGLLLIGVSKKARDTNSVDRYLRSITDFIERKSTRQVRLSEKEAAALRTLSTRLYIRQRGILKFLRKGEIAILSSVVEDKKGRLRVHARRIARYSSMLGKTKHPSK